MKKLIYLSLLSVLITACNNKKENTAEYAATVMSATSLHKSEAISIADAKDAVNGKDIADINDGSAAPPPQEPEKQPIKTVEKKKIIKDGKMGIQVDNLEKAKKQIDTLVKSLGGYYSSENLSNSDNESGYNLVIRIPVEQFDKFISMQEIGKNKILYKEVSARDVTEEYIDLKTRLDSKRNALGRYKEIMKKAGSTKDIIEIQEAIRQLEEEIETTTGKLRYLSDCVDYSTLTLTISTQKDFSYKIPKRDNFWEKLKESVVEGWFGLVDFILSIFQIWPLLIATGIITYIGRRAMKRWLKKRKAKKEPKS